MKRLIFLLLILLVLGFASALLAWQYSCSTTWDGSNWQTCSRTFTPGSTTGYFTFCSPKTIDCYSGPCGSSHAEWWFADGRLWNAAINVTCNLECGGVYYEGPLTLSTNLTYNLSAWFDWRNGLQLQTCGPATSIVANPKYICSTEGPGGE